MAHKAGSDDVTIRVTLIGEPRLLLPGGQSKSLERRDAALLALLILRGPLSRPELAKALWSDSDELARGVNLRQRLMKLRRLCKGHDLVQGSGTLRVAQGVAHDLGPLLDQGIRLSIEAGAQLFGSMDFCRTGALERWVEGARDRLMAVRRRHLEEQILTLKADGRYAAAVEQATHWVHMEPLVERAQVTLIRLLYEMGNRDGAHRALTRCLLNYQDAGRSPGHDLRELEVLVESMARVLPHAPDAVPVALTCPPRIIGREDVLVTIEAAWRLGRVVLIEGEAGIGKSRILRELCSASSSRLYCAIPASPVGEPYGGLRAIVRAVVDFSGPALDIESASQLARLIPELGPPAEGPFLPGRILAALEAFLTATDATLPTAIAIDDCHRLDQATLETLAALVERTSGLPLSWLLCARTLEENGVVAKLAAREQVRTERVLVPPLSTHHVEELVRSLGLIGGSERARRIWGYRLAEVCCGSPFQVLERLQAVFRGHGPDGFELESPPGLVDRVPGSLTLLLDERIASLSSDAIALARVAAVAGAQLSVALAARILGRPSPIAITDAWSELERKGVFARAGSGFVHDLLRDHLLNSLPQAIAQSVHAEIAKAGEELKLSDIEVAEHFRLAGSDEQAGRAFSRAAQIAKARNRRSEELDLWDRAADCLDAAAQTDAAFAARAKAFDAATVTVPPLQLSDRAAELSRLARTATQHFTAALARFEAAANRRIAAEAMMASESAVSLLPSLQSPDPSDAEEVPRHLKARLFRAIGLAMDGQFSAAIVEFEDAVRDAGTVLTPTGRLEILQAEGYVWAHAGRLNDAERAYTEAVQLAEEVDDLSVVVAASGWLAQILARRGAHDRALSAAERCERAYMLLGETHGVPALVVQAIVGTQLARTGRYEDGLAKLKAAQTAGQRSGLAAFEVTCREHIARVHLVLGQLNHAATVLGPWPEDLDQGRVHHQLLDLEIRGATGAPIRSELFALRSVAERASLVERAYFHLLCARMSAADEALPECDAALSQLPAAGLESLILEALTLRADAYAQIGQSDLALADCRRARELSKEYRPMAMFIGEFIVRLTRAMDRCGENAEAKDVLDNHLDWLNRSVMPYMSPPIRATYMRANHWNVQLLDMAGGMGLPVKVYRTFLAAG